MKILNKIATLFLMSLISISLVHAQTSRKDKKAAHAAEIKSMVEAQDYVFDANYVTPMRGISRSLNSPYDLVISKDTITAFLPYFGQAYQAPYNPTDGGIKFTTTKFSYNSKVGKKGDWTITIKPTDRSISNWRDVQTMTLSISTDGYASLQVISTNRDPISFNGTIEKRDHKK
ncbi:MAG: DUF4251 domain-containing protein [Mucilaginibacter sp.]|uniref:DUF4251 domain-containing protein n=1 Tax=Mucilaginibacter sp. TaxID=1882438 RepID=UPI0031ABC1CC